MIRYVGVILSLLLLYALTSASSTEIVAIRAGNILPISGNAMDNGVILIEDGKIKALGQDVNIPADARIIEASDKFVIPGLIDAQSRLYMIENELNESRPIAPELSILDALDPFMEEYEEVLAQGITAVYVSQGVAAYLAAEARF